MIFVFLASVLVAILGLCIGSFLNCVIYRTELQEDMPDGPGRKAVSFLRGKSFCPNCRHTLSWLDLVPVFSYLFLRGKCRYCGKKISIQYPLVEIATGLTFLLIFNFKFIISSQFLIGQFINLGFLFYVASALIIIFIYDLKHSLIPESVLIPAIIITLIYNFSAIGGPASGWQFFISSILATAASALFFFLLYWLSKERAMGFGDVELVILMGLLLGWPNIFVALFLAFFFGAIIGLILMAFDKKGLKSQIPFGPFLIGGTFLALFYGDAIIQWYLRLFSI